MSLIDRDLLLSEIEKSRGKNPHKDSKIRANHTIEHDHIAHLVLEQPVAYNMDKVVEQMEEYVKESSNVDYNRAMIEAIEIVKSGGIE